jgi:CubicO group peptidase (beta-lactamase class C family)
MFVATQANEHEASINGDAEKLVAEALSADMASGIQVAVIKNGQLVFSYAVGHADLEQDVRLKTRTRMRIGSLSKLFTDTMVARLAQDGQIDIDANIREYVPDFPDKGVSITARQIANHTSGIRHYDFSNMSEANNTQFYESLADALSIFADDPLLGEPGTMHHYSSHAVNLLGVVAERVAQTPFPQALAQSILVPLGLSNTMPDHPLAIIYGRTRFYTVYDGQLINTFWRDSSDYYPSGGMLSTAEDLARFTYAVFETDFLDAERQELIRTEAKLIDGTPVGYTFGWQISSFGSSKLMYHHGGETNGAYGNVMYVPDDDLIVTGLSNYNVFPDQRDVAFFYLVRDQLPNLFQAY